ncbi:MAG: class I SAM-dependent methyltransferase [Oscillospiraceae bacterium]|nr:class I SAM-dependent methyltransferase [Oscillospiraceae bacterium]
MDKRLVFDTIPERFDKWRIRYSRELFDAIIEKCGLAQGKRCLEIGPGTGQATDFALDTGCDYTAIELGEHLAAKMCEKYSSRPNFTIINADFEKYDFEPQSFDVVYSAATIQWIDQDIAYRKVFDILRPGGYLAMFFLYGDYKTPCPELFDRIQKVYDAYFVTDQPYTQKFDYKAGADYGFEYLGETHFHNTRTYTADEYIEYIKTHSTHITINEKYRDRFFGGIHEAVESFGGITFNDTYPLHLYRRPL